MAHILDLRHQQEHSLRRHCIPIGPPALRQERPPARLALHLQLMVPQAVEPRGPLDSARSKTHKEGYPAAGRGVRTTSEERITWTITRDKLRG
jgi:hypothetical protein